MYRRTSRLFAGTSAAGASFSRAARFDGGPFFVIGVLLGPGSSSSSSFSSSTSTSISSSRALRTPLTFFPFKIFEKSASTSISAPRLISPSPSSPCIATASSTSPALCAVPRGAGTSSSSSSSSSSSIRRFFRAFAGLALALLLFFLVTRFGVLGSSVSSCISTSPSPSAARCISSSSPGSHVMRPIPRSARTALKSTPGGKTMYLSRAGVRRRHWTKQSSTQVWFTIGIDQEVALSVFVPCKLELYVSVQ